MIISVPGVLLNNVDPTHNTFEDDLFISIEFVNYILINISFLIFP